MACLSGACLLLGCGNTGTPAQNYGGVLEYVTEQVILPEHQDFVTQASALVVAAQALSDKPSAKSLAAAQAAWRKTRKAWRTLDAVRIGPDLNDDLTAPIDGSPVDAPGIEAIVTGTGAVDDNAVANAGNKKKGFLGLEYLIFPDPSAVAGTPAPALADDDAAPRRRTFAVSMADEIKSYALSADNAWEPSGGNFAQQVELAGAGSTTYPTQRAAVDDLVGGGAAGALELIVGVRLALPLGRKNGGAPDPTQDPTSRSDSAVADMEATLAGVAALYTGQGFSSVIGTGTPLDTTVSAELDQSEQALEAIPAPFSAALVVADPAQNTVQLAYTALDALKQTWNTDVSSALGATVKPSDTDGD
jgi:predicted lipoprotein